MRENKKKKTGGLFSRHTAPDKKGKHYAEDEYDPYEPEQEDVEPPYDDDDYADEQPDMAYEQDEADEIDEQPDDDYYDDGEEDYPEADEAEDTAAHDAHRDSRRKAKIAALVVACILIVLAAGVTVGGYMVTNSTTNFPNLRVGGVTVGGMDAAATKAAIENSGWDEKASVPLTVTLLDRASFDVELYESGAMHTVDEAVELACAYGHTGNWYVNLIEYVKCFLRPVDVNETTIVYNSEYIQAQCQAGIDKLNEELGDGSHTIDKENSLLCLEKGAGQLEFDLADMEKSITDALDAGKKELSYSYLASDPTMPDFEKLYEELKAEPADAYFTDDNTFTVVDDIEGCDFDVEEAESIWKEAEPGETVEIPIELTFPEVTGDYLRSLLYRDKLGSMTTYFPNSNDNRISNIQLACSKIDGLILYPGDVFSYNDTLGERTEEAGFKLAGAYSNGEVVEELGGGICQVSSTLYSAVLYSYQVTTVMRSPHYFPVDYMEKGYDATVSWPKPDFQFRNDREYPIKIVTHCDAVERSLTIEIWGTNLDGTYIELTKDTYSYMNDRYPWIMEGYGVQVHRNVFDANGIQIDRIDEIYDIYHTHEATEQIKALDAAAAAQAAEAPIAG